MQDGYNNNGGDREEIFSKVVRAGKRTYFFDVKSTRANDYYITITESKKRFSDDGKFSYEKHKLFLYKEDFEKFADGFTDVIEYIKENAPEIDKPVSEKTSDDKKDESDTFSDVSFEDI